MNDKVFVYLSILLGQHFFGGNSKLIDGWFDKMFPKNYSSYKPPLGNLTKGINTGPAIVYCRVVPKFVTEISMKNMQFYVDLITIVEWQDHRLKLPKMQTLDDRPITLTKNMAEKLWYPFMAYTGCIEAYCRLVTPDKDGPTGVVVMGKLWLQSNKVGFRVYYRKSFRFPCSLDLEAYPFDAQNCFINVMWKYKIGEPVDVIFTTPTNKQMPFPPGFRLIRYSIKTCNFPSVLGAQRGCKAVSFNFYRIYSQHLMLIFIPSVLIVMLSWLSFWLNTEAAAPRVALGLTSLLTLATQFNAAQKDLPPDATIKAIDIWMFTCIFMIFASLVEFGIANWYGKYESTDSNGALQAICPQIHPKQVERTTSAESSIKEITKIFNLCVKVLRSNKKTNGIDYIARILFPSSFLVFNIVFWNNFRPIWEHNRIPMERIGLNDIKVEE